MLASFGIFATALLVAMAVSSFVFPERTNELKLLGLPALLTEIVTALRLLFRGLPTGATAEARA